MLPSLLMLVAVSCGNASKQAESIAPLLGEGETEIVLVEAGDEKVVELVRVWETDSLLIFWPRFDKIDLVCGEMPKPNVDKDVVFTCSAAFTGDILPYFSHGNIAGDHVSDGRKYSGYWAEVNTGMFVYYAGKWKFTHRNDFNEVKSAVKYGGMMFKQNLIICEGRVQPLCTRKTYKYRALCEKGGKLCVVEAKEPMPYPDFVNCLVARDVTNSIYLDAGKGWDYMWFRYSSLNMREKYPSKSAFATNWLTFYCEHND